MLQVKNSIINTQNGGELFDSIVKVSATSVVCINVISPTFITSTGSNNISSDSTAADLGIGTGSVDFTGAFADSANNDYRIKQSWADVNLVSNGWNSSDIASFAYYTDVVPGISIPVIINQLKNQGV